MEKDPGFMGEGKACWNSCSQTNEVKCCFLHPNWDNSMDQSGPFESALSSMACSPAASNGGSSNFPSPGDNAMMRELVGKLGNICNTYTGDNISPQSFIKPKNNTCALNSPPKLNLSMVDSQMRGNLKFPSVGNQLLNHPSLAPISADPGFTSPENGDSKEESSISVQIPAVDSQNDANARKRKSTPSPAPALAKMPKEDKDESDAKRSKQQNGNVKAANDGNQKHNKETPKPLEPPKDYIHVRARRGQATDSHSLAERVRREKISERMKFLQDLVPGCNKVTGKAVMLDEIINYVQSLQRQVEFLSMKLATVNPRMNVNMEALLSKDMFQSRGSLPHALYSMDSSAPTFGSGYQPQQALPMNNGMSNNTEIQFLMNPITDTLHKTQGLQLPPVDCFTNYNPQIGSFLDDDLQSIVQMGFGQNQPQSYQSKHT